MKKSILSMFFMTLIFMSVSLVGTIVFKNNKSMKENLLRQQSIQSTFAKSAIETGLNEGLIYL